MDHPGENALHTGLATGEQRQQLARLAYRRHWGPAFVLVGWLHLVAFAVCWYLTAFEDYHDSSGYLAIWVGELIGMGLIFRLCGGPRSEDRLPGPLEVFIRRVWITYFILAFNLGALNTLRGHAFFEFFPAMATLASFAFAMMAVAVQRRFFLAVLVMYGSGLLMAASLPHAYLIFALAWWLVLNVLGLALLGHRPPLAQETPQHVPRYSGDAVIHGQAADVADRSGREDRAAAGGVEEDQIGPPLLRIGPPRQEPGVSR